MDDISLILDRALISAQRIRFSDPGVAHRWRRRAHHIRAKTQKELKAFGPHPWYNLTLRIQGNDLIIESIAPLEVESI